MTAPTIPFVDLQAQRARIGADLDRAIQAVLDHGRFIMGPEIAELERELAARAGVAHALTCSSGTDALLLALMARDVGPGDAVFVPAFTFPATAETVVLLGATPVFVDVRGDTFNMDPQSLEAALPVAAAAGLRPAAVVPVDLFGQPADYPALTAIADTVGAWVLADAAQSFGAARGGVPAGALGDVAATSFFPAKPLGCYGDGGAVFTADAGLAATIRSLRAHGKGDHKYDIVRVGVNGRLDTLQAAVLLCKLAIFDDEIDARRRVAARYAEGLAGVVTTPTVDPDTTSVWAQYTIQVDDRDGLAERLAAQGVPTAVYYPAPMHRQAPYKAFPTPPGGLPTAERLAARVLSLPMHPYLEPGTQDRVIDAVIAALGDR